MTRIIVGVDGSESSENALRWALEEADLRQVERVSVVHAFRPPEVRNYSAYTDPFLDAGAMQRRTDTDRARREEDETHANQAAERLLERLLSDARTDPIGADVELLALPNDPAKTLIDMSRDADLLVVGSRGRGGFKGLLLGSVSQQCLQHSRCPVVIVR
ncbi:MAG: universal stress protein [Intrasporangiaceae bacterium]|nr:universal stress protein [Intrasporangiaceae bacterium]